MDSPRKSNFSECYYYAIINIFEFLHVESQIVQLHVETNFLYVDTHFLYVETHSLHEDTLNLLCTYLTSNPLQFPLIGEFVQVLWYPKYYFFSMCEDVLKIQQPHHYTIIYNLYQYLGGGVENLEFTFNFLHM